MIPVIAMIAFGAALVVGEQRVTVRAYGCDFTRTRTATVFAYNGVLLGEGGRKVQVPVVVTSDKGMTFEFALPPGPFRVSYDADGQECSSGEEGLIILPGHERHLVVSMFPGVFMRDWHGRKFFAGTIPLIGLAVSVVLSESGDCPTAKSPETAATIDEGAYYIGHLHGSHTFLKLRSAGNDVLYVALPDASPVESNDEFVVRNITFSDLRELTTHGLNSYVGCVKLPSGSSSRFDL